MWPINLQRKRALFHSISSTQWKHPNISFIPILDMDIIVINQSTGQNNFSVPQIPFFSSLYTVSLFIAPFFLISSICVYLLIQWSVNHFIFIILHRMDVVHRCHTHLCLHYAFHLQISHTDPIDITIKCCSMNLVLNEF